MKFEIALSKNFSFKLGIHEINVKFVDPDDPSMQETDGGFTSGYWDIKRNEIRIAKSLPYSLKLSTLMHELLHVFEDYYSVKLKHRDVNLIGDWLAQFLMENFLDEEE